LHSYGSTCINEKGGTILCTITKEGMVVVDSQFPDSAQPLIDELKKKTHLVKQTLKVIA